MKRKPLSKSEIKDLNKLLETYEIKFDKKDKIELVENKYYAKDREIILFYSDSIIIPTLKYILKNKVNMKEIIVDMGAIKFVVNGADIMRPGIVCFDENISVNDFVLIKDEKNKTPIAIGKALLDSKNLTETKLGKVIQNIHFIGDDLWKMVL